MYSYAPFWRNLLSWKYEMVRLCCMFLWKVYTQKINNICEIKETKCHMCIWIFLVQRSWNLGSYFRRHFWWKYKFLTNLIWHTFLHFLESLRNKMLYVHMSFPSSPRKSYIPHTLFLDFSALPQNDTDRWLVLHFLLPTVTNCLLNLAD